MGLIEDYLLEKERLLNLNIQEEKIFKKKYRDKKDKKIKGY